jgi:hypothetical protein
MVNGPDYDPSGWFWSVYKSSSELLYFAIMI